MSLLSSSVFNTVKGLDAVAARLPRFRGFQPLKGTFSAYAELTQGRLPGGILAEHQTPGPIPVGSITQRSNLNQHDFQPWPVFWTMAEDARLVGKIRVWRNPGDHYCSEGNYHLTEKRRLSEDRLLAQIHPGEPTLLAGAWTSIASNWGDGRNYYHWITDNLTRLRLREELPEPTRIILPTASAPYIKESLELLGISHECEMPEQHCLRPDRYYFCSPLAMTGVWNPLGFDWLRKRFSQHYLTAHSGQPIFLTRRSANRVPDQLELIEQTARDCGFQIVDCGSLTMRRQIELASAAPAIAGIHGAAMTNILWSVPGTPVLELFQPTYLNGCYEQIAFQGNLTYQAHLLEGEKTLDDIKTWLRHAAD